MTASAVDSAAERPLRALLLAFEFPPLANGGVYRALGLAETLPAEGVELEIVTVRETDSQVWSTGRLDPALVSRVPARGVYRTASGFPAWYWRLTRGKVGFRVAQYLYLGDPVSLFWRKPLLAAVDRIVRERRPDIILATAPPFGVAVLARTVARRHHLPWVVDWRDPWSMWCAAPFPTYAHYHYARFQEQRLLREANASVATSHVTRDDWARTTRRIDAARLITVYNGFDRPAVGPVDSDGAVPPARDHADRAGELRRIVYVGSFYYSPRANGAALRPMWRRPPQQWLFYSPRREDWRFRSPYYFLRGLRRFADRCPQLVRRLRVEFAGTVPDWLPGMLDDTGTNDFVTLHGPVSHARSLALQRHATAVLLTSAHVSQGRDYSIAGKLYEYFGLRRPILGVLTDGAMRDLVEQSGLGLLAEPEDEEAVATQIARVASAPGCGLRMTPDDAFLARFERRATAREMAAVLRRAVAEGYRG